MRRIASLTLMPLILVMIGAGCGRDVSFIASPQATPEQVPANLEGAHGSTGGQAATVTPSLETPILISAFPDRPTGWSVDEPRELKQPVPLPDGTATTYTSVTRTYSVLISKGKYANIKVLLTDTRGIPALTAFLHSYQERSDDAGYRSKISIAGQEAWITYAYGPQRETDGQGSITLLSRGRFLIQMDGEQGISAETLRTLAGLFHFDALK